MEKRTKAEASPPALAGPHACSRVANRISTLLKNALIETSRVRNHPLDQDEIAHIIDLVMDSQELFPVFQHAYSNCVSLSQAGKLQEMDQMAILRFVTDVLCRDILPTVFPTQIAAAGDEWKRAFVAGFANYLAADKTGTLGADLHHAYQALVIGCDQDVTPMTVLHDQHVTQALAETLSRIRPSDSTKHQQMAKEMESHINKEISIALELKGPSPLKIYTQLASRFVDAIYQSSSANPFRSEVLKAA